MRRPLAFALPLVIVGLLAVLLLVWAHPVVRDSSVVNEGWNGLSNSSADLEASPLSVYDDLAGVPSSATLIVMPRLAVGEVTVDALDLFTRNGGTLVVLDDFGFGNELLERLDVDMRLTQGLLRDPLYCHRDESIPRVEFAYAEGDREPGVMVLNHGSWLEVGAGSSVWAWSSFFSYGDRDGDGVHDSGEPNGPLPVAASAARGSGRVVLVADSSLLLNGTMSLGNNVEAVAQWAHGPVLIDQAHLPEAEMDRSRRVLDGFRGALGDGGGSILLIIMVFCCAVGYTWYNRERPDDD
ncbi:MAG: hypothetical protein JXA58_08470 [Dehalococcoidia bacterium]|nr:hypothetical protein [Dehalococcoidia bacterium]